MDKYFLVYYLVITYFEQLKKKEKMGTGPNQSIYRLKRESWQEEPGEHKRNITQKTGWKEPEHISTRKTPLLLQPPEPPLKNVLTVIMQDAGI